MSQPRPDFQFVHTFCDDQDYQSLLEKARSNKKLNNSTVEALKVDFGLDHLEINRRKWLLRSIYLSVWHYVCILQAQGMKSAAIAQDLRQCTGLPYEARLIGLYANEDFFKSLYEGTTSTMPIMPSPNGRGDTWAVNTMRSAANQDEGKRYECSVISFPIMRTQQQSQRLLENGFTYMTDGPMSPEDEGRITSLNDYTMQPGVSSSVSGKNLKFEQISQPGLRTSNLDPMPGPGPYFSNHQFSEYIQPQDMMNQVDYHQNSSCQPVFSYQHADLDQVQAMHPGDNDMQDPCEPFADERYGFQNMHEELSQGPNNLSGPRLDSDIGQNSQYIDPRLLDL